MTSFNAEPIVASECERSDLAKLEHLLNLLNNGQQNRKLQIIDPETGDRILLPDSIFHLLRQVVHQFDQGKGVIIETFHQPLTINEAAYLLNVSRQHLEKLLAQGEIPFTEGEIMPLIQFEDIMAYKKQWEELRQQKLADIVQISEEYGLYSMETQSQILPENMLVD